MWGWQFVVRAQSSSCCCSFIHLLVLMMDPRFSPHISTWSRNIFLQGGGMSQIKLLRSALTCSLCKVNGRCPFTARQTQRAVCMKWTSWWTECDFRGLSGLQDPERHCVANCFPNWRKKTLTDVTWCYFVLCVCTLTEYWKGHPFWLLSHWEPTCHAADMTLFECSVYMWSELQRAPQMTKWLRVSKQPTNRPVLFQTGSWEQQRRCLVSSASSTRCLPASSQQTCLMVCTSPCWMADLISACVTHLLLVTSCRALSVSRARPGPMCFSSLLSSLQTGARVHKQASMIRVVQRVRGAVEAQRASVQLMPWAITSHILLQTVQAAQCKGSLLKSESQKHIQCWLYIKENKEGIDLGHFIIL